MEVINYFTDVSCFQVHITNYFISLGFLLRGSTPNSTQELQLDLLRNHSWKVQGNIWYAGIIPMSITCKARTLPGSGFILETISGVSFPDSSDS